MSVAAAQAGGTDTATARGLPGSSVELRVRSPWHALDLGVALLARHARVLYASWFLVSLPLVALALALPVTQRWWGLALFWWLKPLFERLTVFCLGRELFGQKVSLGALLRAFPGLLRVQLVSTLSVRRFSPTRALDAPVILLEGARGLVRRARLLVLHRNAARHALLAFVVFAWLESTLALSLVFLIVAFVPDSAVQAQDGLTALQAWASLLLTPAYLLAVWLIGPLHAACGFALYINRRCELEGWDIEVGFRRLAERLQGQQAARAGLLRSSGTVLLCVGLAALLLLDVGAPVARAEPLREGTALTKQPERPLVAPAARSPSAAQSRRLIRTVMASPEFHERTTLTYPAFLEDSSDSERSEQEPLPQALMKFISALAEVAWWLLWGALLLALVFIAWRYRTWLAQLLDRSPPAERLVAPTLIVAGVELGGGAALHDSLAQAEALWADDQRRLALAMLLRLCLTRLIAAGCRFRNGDTEADCLRVALLSQPAPTVEYLRLLLECWIPLAYGHVDPDVGAVTQLFTTHTAALALVGGTRP